MYPTYSLCRYNTDFGQEKEILKWITGYLDATKAGLLTHVMGDGGPVNVVYSSFDWSPNA
uniref:Electron transporter n=1 Tax=Solanum tuberosum TaxID=4113 RepID=M1BCS0_SOLTU